MSAGIQSYPGCDAAARHLLQARASGVASTGLPPACRPQTIEQALAVQLRTATLVQDMRQEGIAAWKCALPAAEKISIAPIYASRVQHSTDGPFRLEGLAAQAPTQGIEPELAFELKHDLPVQADPYSSEQIDQAVGAIRLAVEVLGCRYSAPQTRQFPELLADHLFNEGLILGPELPHDQTPPCHLALTLSVGATCIETRQGSHPNHDPKAGLYWLVNFLREQNLAMHKGQHIVTGSYAGVFQVPVGQPISLRYGDIGTLDCRFSLV